MKLEETGPDLTDTWSQESAHGRAHAPSAVVPCAAWVLAASAVLLGCTAAAVLGLMGGAFSLFFVQVFMIHCHYLGWPH